jgi:hypothetical protein
MKNLLIIFLLFTVYLFPQKLTTSAPTRLDLYHYYTDDLHLEIAVLDDSGDGFDFTGYTGTFNIKRDESTSAALKTFSVSFTDSIIIIDVDSDSLTFLRAPKLVYYTLLLTHSGVPKTWLAGKFDYTVRPSDSQISSLSLAYSTTDLSLSIYGVSTFKDVLSDSLDYIRDSIDTRMLYKDSTGTYFTKFQGDTVKADVNQNAADIAALDNSIDTLTQSAYDSVAVLRDAVDSLAITKGEINVKDYGASPTASEAVNVAAFQAALDAAIAGGQDTAVVVIPPGLYNIGETIRFNNPGTNRNTIIFQGKPGAIIKLTADNDTLLNIVGFSSMFMLDNLILRGKPTNIAIGHAYGTTGTTHNYKRLYIDTFKTCFDIEDLTNVLIEQTYMVNGEVGIRAGYNSDSHTYESNNFFNLDTAIVIHGSSSDGFTMFGNTFGLCDVGIKFTSSGGFNLIGGYWEGVGHLGVIGNGAGLRNINIIGTTFQGQGVTTRPFSFYDQDHVNIIGTKATGFDTLANFYDATARVYAANGYGGLIKLKDNVNFTYSLTGRTIKNYIRETSIFGLDGATTNRNPHRENRYVFGAANRYMETWRTTSSIDTATNAIAWIGTYDGTTMEIGTDKAVWKLGTGLGSTPTASASTLGWLWATATDLQYCRNVAGTPTWQTLYSASSDTALFSVVPEQLDSLVDLLGNVKATRDTAGVYHRKVVYNFGDAADSYQNFDMPLQIGATGTKVWVEIYWHAAATTGAVNWGVQIGGVALNASYDPVHTATIYGGTTTSGTTLYQNKTRIEYPMASDLSNFYSLNIKFRRDGDGSSGTDDMSGDAILDRVVVKYLAVK